MTEKESNDDSTLFKQAMQNVKPLGKTKQAELIREKKPVYVRPKPVEVISAAAYYFSDPYDFSITSNERLSFCREGLNRARFRDLERGLIVPEARLDLHRITAETAKERLSQFINQAITKNQRCVLIIHGKGGQHGEAPILKNLVNHWLPQIPEVLALSSAVPRDGGTGAVYVFMKRSKN